MTLANKEEFITSENNYVYLSNQVLDNYEKLSAQYNYACHELEQNPSDEVVALKALQKKQELELMVEEFDFTGSYNSEVFHRDLGSYIRGTEISIDSEGKVKEFEDEYTWVGVSLNGLAPINSFGGHSAGNSALVEIVSSLEGVLAEYNLSVEDFKIYHNKASDFTLRVANNTLTESELGELMTKIAEIQLQSGLVLKDKFGGVMPRLAVSKIKMSDITELYNDVQDRLEEQGVEKIDLSDDAKAGKFFAGLVSDSLDVYREQEFLDTLMDDILDRMVFLSDDVRSNDREIQLLKNYYETYVQRFFMHTELGDFDRLFNEFVSLPSASDKASVLHDLQTLSNEISAQSAIQRAFSNRDERNVVSENLLDLAFNKARKETYTLQNIAIANEPLTSEDLKEYKHDLLFRSTAEEISIEEVQKQYITERKKYLIVTEKSLKDLDVYEPFEELEDADLIFLQGTFKNLMTAFDKGDFIDLNKPISLGTVTIDIRTILQSDLSRWSAEKFQLVNRLCKTLYETHEQKVDHLTGLDKKEIFYKKMDIISYEAVCHGDNLIARVADEGFLRGTNDLAGRAAGDAMLSVGAFSAEKAANDFAKEFKGVKRVVSRYGGDEFATFVKVDKSVDLNKAEEFYTSTLFSTAGKHKIPPENESKLANYIPHEIQISDGACDIAWGIMGVETLLNVENLLNEEDHNILSKTLSYYKEHGKLAVVISEELSITDEEIRFFSQFLGRTMFNIADKYMDIKKSYERPIYIYNLYKNLTEAEEALSENASEDTKRELERANRVFNLHLSYSQKALGNKSREEFAQLDERIKELRQKGAEVNELELIEETFGLHVFKNQEASIQEQVIKELVELELYASRTAKTRNPTTKG